MGHCCCCLVVKLCLTLCDPMDCSPPGSSVHGISQARIMGWVAISFSRGSSRPRDPYCVLCIGRQLLYHWVTLEAIQLHYLLYELEACGLLHEKVAECFSHPCPTHNTHLCLLKFVQEVGEGRIGLSLCQLIFREWINNKVLCIAQRIILNILGWTIVEKNMKKNIYVYNRITLLHSRN